MRLIPIRALDQTETEWIKVADTKNCIGKQTPPIDHLHSSTLPVSI